MASEFDPFLKRNQSKLYANEILQAFAASQQQGTTQWLEAGFFHPQEVKQLETILRRSLPKANIVISSVKADPPENWVRRDYQIPYWQIDVKPKKSLLKKIFGR